MKRVLLPSLFAALALTSALAQNAHTCADQARQPTRNFHALGQYAGSWTIVRGDPAPWSSAQLPVHPDKIKRLVGRHVVVEAAHVRGPDDLLNCKNPGYSTASYSVMELFQGGLEKSVHGDETKHNAEANALATRLGFSDTRPIATLNVDCGCGGGVDFHALNDNELLFALDNVIYRLHRNVPTRAPKGHTP